MLEETLGPYYSIALSIDYGITWSDVPLSAFALWTTTKNWKTIASSANGDKIIAATSVDANTNRIWTSSDGGATWTNQTNAPANKVWQGVSSSADGTKLAAVATGAWSTTPVVCTSNDSGVTWTEHTSLPSFVWMGVASSADGIKIAIVTYHGDIWTSSDSGVSWIKCDAPSTFWSAVASNATGTKRVATVGLVGVGNIWINFSQFDESQCCKTTPYRNPILGYRKHLVDCPGNSDLSGCGYTNDVSGNVYKDNYAKTCGDPANSLVCYNPVIKLTQNRNGCVNESYNYSTNQYLTRRCLTFSQQEFNFQSQVPVDASGCCTKFMSCANCQYDSSGACDCSTNGFCTPCGHSQACIGINKLPCEVKNTKCYAIYKRSNPKFNRQGAVSGGSRINRLKYQTRIVAQGRKVNGRNNVINRRGPAANYMTSRPLTMDAPGCWLNKDRTRSGLAQRCIVTDPCCPTTSGGVVACCDETLPEGVIKLCTAGHPGCDDCPWDYEMVGYLNDPQYPDWAGYSGCDPSCGRLGHLPYPTLLGTICPPDASYNNTTTTTTTTIGGFAWNFNESERHLWFFLQTAHGFNVDGTNATGFQFTSVEFSSSSSFLPANTVKLYGRELDIDYKSNTEYEVHWSGEDGLTNWSSATITKIDDIFGKALNANKNVYIKFDLGVPADALAPDGFEAIPGASPSYITIRYNQSLALAPAPAKENFSAENVTQGVSSMDISAIDIITTTITNDTVNIELNSTAIAGSDVINLSYDTSSSPYIINSTGTQLAPIFSNQNITANPPLALTWSSFGPSVGNWLTCCCSADGTRMAVGNYATKIYTSVDSGVNWSEETGSFTRCESIACSANGLKLVAYCNTFTQRRIWTALDSGAGYVWTEHTNWPDGDGNMINVHLASDANGVKLAATSQWPGGPGSSYRYIYTSTNSGANWARAGNAPEQPSWYGITSDSTGTELAAVVWFGNIWVSHDSGATWTETIPQASTSWFSIAYSADASVLAAVVFSITVGVVDGTIWLSNDQGVNWFKPTTHPVLSGPPKWQSITVSSDGSKLTCVLDAKTTTDYAIWHSYDGGITWSADTADPPGDGILGYDIASSSTQNTEVMVGGTKIWVGTK